MFVKRLTSLILMLPLLPFMGGSDGGVGESEF